MSVARLDSQLCFALYCASNHITSIYRRVLDPLDLTYTQFVVLMALWEQDDISISQIAKRTRLSKATMTPLLKRLEEKKFIHRNILSDNERQKSITLTMQGRSLATKSAEITNQVFCATGLSEKQANTMISLCKKIVD